MTKCLKLSLKLPFLSIMQYKNEDNCTSDYYGHPCPCFIRLPSTLGPKRFRNKRFFLHFFHKEVTNWPSPLSSSFSAPTFHLGLCFAYTEKKCSEVGEGGGKEQNSHLSIIFFAEKIFLHLASYDLTNVLFLNVDQ